MTDSCKAEGCECSPKYACVCDPKLNYCEIHLSEHLAIGESHKPILNLTESKKIEQKTQQEMTHLLNASTKALIAGKQMFQEICNKLCKITDDLTERQQNLIELGAQSKFDINAEENIKKLSQVGLKFRSTEDFQKLVEKHFSESDDNMDLSLFSAKFEEIIEKLAVNNGFLQLVADKNARERQELDMKIQNVAQENSDKQAMLEKKLEEMSIFIKEFAKNDQVINLKDRATKLEDEVEELKKRSNEHASSIKLYKTGINNQEKKIETQCKTLTDFCKKSLKEMSDNQAILESNLNGQKTKCEDNDKIFTENAKNLQAKVDEINNILNQNIENMKKIQNDFDLKINSNTGKIMQQDSDLSKKIEELKKEFKEFYENKYSKNVGDLEKRINESHTGATVQFNSLNINYGDLAKDVVKLNNNMKLMEPIIKKLEEEERKRREEERKIMEARQKISIKHAVDFNASTLDKKRERVRTFNLQAFFCYDNQYLNNIFITYDEKYVFVCIL
ncbi:hypothetical protein SteCoe_36105 [Stentor coeruleus]|uniref:Uncharacterized protein n=1 Tax=Stentor coeruleus TaxID=5963 RepID=A0A1R2AQT1_9CILI|nr:hypothetical protein SteCoe_36105 [Stentor coeruleus]